MIIHRDDNYPTGVMISCHFYLQRFAGLDEFTCSIWGPTCDGLDCISKEWKFPELDIGDWMQFDDMGAYTLCAASSFNGMPKPKPYYTIQEQEW